MRFTIARKQKLKKECQVSFKKYLNSISKDYEFIKKYANLKGELCGITLESIIDLPYKVLKKDIPNLFNDSKFDEAIHLILSSYNKKITIKKVIKQKNEKKLIFLLWVKKQYEAIEEMEQNYLSNQPDVKLLQAGIKDLDVLGDFVNINNLVKQWNGAYTHEEVESLKYSFIFDAMLENTIMSRVNKNLVEINKQSR